MMKMTPGLEEKAETSTPTVDTTETAPPAEQESESAPAEVQEEKPAEEVTHTYFFCSFNYRLPLISAPFDFPFNFRPPRPEISYFTPFNFRPFQTDEHFNKISKFAKFLFLSAQF